MSRFRQTLIAVALGVLVLGIAPSAWAGDVVLSWDPSGGASGYKIYHGTSSGQYGTPIDVGNVTQSTVNSLTDCATHYFATTAYNVAGESGFSTEVTSWPRAMLTSVAPVSGDRGTQLTLTLSGNNFEAGDVVSFSNAGVTVDSVSVDACAQLTVNVTVGTSATVGATDITVTHSSGVAVSASGLFTVTADTGGPQLSAIQSSGIDDTSATIGWTTDEPASSQVFYRVSGAGTYQSTVLNSSLVTNHSVGLSGLSEGTTYEYHVQSVDAAGNTSTSADQSFTTTDNIVPQISAIAANGVTATAATIEWTTDEGSTSSVFYRLVGAADYVQTDDSATLVTSHSVVLTGLDPNSAYGFYVESTDAAGNTSTSSPDDSFTTLTSPYRYIRFEAEMGRLSSPVQESVGSSAFSGALIETPNGSGSGTATSPLGTAEYGVYLPADGDWTLWVRMYAPNAQSARWFESVDGASRQSVSVAEVGVWRWVSGRSYALTAGLHAVELGGQDRRAQVDRVLLTDDPDFIPSEQPGADTTPPSAVTSFTANVGFEENDLSWNNPTSPDLVETVVRYRTDGQFPVSPADGLPLVAGPATPGGQDGFTHGGLTGGVTYYYSVFAIDAVGNSSDPAQTQATQPSIDPPLPPGNIEVSQLEALLEWMGLG
jgi:hypothetical protein